MALAYQVDEDLWCGSDPDLEIPESYQQEYFVNHSCNGNSWYIGDDELVALRDISPGEEICYDYCLTEADPDWRLECRCGAAECRGVITGNDWKRADLQSKYRDHFTAYITRLINRYQSQDSSE